MPVVVVEVDSPTHRAQKLSCQGSTEAHLSHIGRVRKGCQENKQESLVERGSRHSRTGSEVRWAGSWGVGGGACEELRESQ